MERELFGTVDDKEVTHTGINFDKYDNIPVDATGRDVPEAITEVSCHSSLSTCSTQYILLYASLLLLQLIPIC